MPAQGLRCRRADGCACAGHARQSRRAALRAGLLTLALSAGPVLAQRAPAAAAASTPTPEWRRTDGYRFPALADSVRRLQFAAQAMQLREYCADRRVPDEFVRERLQRFGRMTGREETCASLVDY